MIREIIEDISIWFNEKPERQPDVILAALLTVNLIVISVLLSLLKIAFDSCDHIINSYTALPSLFQIPWFILASFFWVFSFLGIFCLIFLLIYWEVKLTKSNLIARWIKNTKAENKINEELMKEKEQFKKRLSEAYVINSNYFDKTIDIKDIDLYLLNSREELVALRSPNLFKKDNCQEEYLKDKNFVGFSRYTNLIERIFTKKKYVIGIISPSFFSSYSNFAKSFAFKVLVHEVCHLFIESSPKVINFLYQNNLGKENEECLCYYIANQKNYFKEEYKIGKKLYLSLKNKGFLN